jgi:hypothetical protein
LIIIMSATTFLSNETYWETLSASIKAASRVDAAVAYFGQGGAKLLPLRRGDRLIVDLSPATVGAGGADPREIEKLMRRGVQVFTRRNLHAKTVIADNLVISGSANVSTRSQQLLDEAAILTNDQSAVRRAREFIERLCTEPVRLEYVEECKKLYRPPRLNGKRLDGRKDQQRATHAKLWIVNLHERNSLPESEQDRYEEGEAKAERLLKDNARSKTDSFHWSYKPRMATELELGDCIIRVVQFKDTRISVYPPGQLLLIDSYVRDAASGKERYVFHLAVSMREEQMSWDEFRRAAKSLLKPDKLASPRTRAIREIQVADGLLRLWTPGGRVSQR